jgi:hypothetical protein
MLLPCINASAAPPCANLNGGIVAAPRTRGRNRPHQRLPPARPRPSVDTQTVSWLHALSSAGQARQGHAGVCSREAVVALHPWSYTWPLLKPLPSLCCWRWQRPCHAQAPHTVARCCQ